MCARITRGWTPFFPIAAGIITETGGALSNPATIARKCGVPVVVAVKDATTRIRNGQIITIDGASGVVSVQE